MREADLARLHRLAMLLRDRDLAELRGIAEARARVEAQLQGLCDPAEAPDLPPVAEAQARLAWEAWADQQRSRLNLRLAQLHAAQAEAESRARSSHGRAQVLDGLIRRQGSVRRPA